MRYSVVIPTYNNHEGCSKLIRSIEAAFSGSVLKRKEIEIIVVDDYPDEPFSVDSSLRLRILRNRKNMGGGYTRNKGAKEASGEYIIFLDDDTTVMKDFFTKVEKFIQRNDPDIFSGMIIPEVHDIPSIFFTILQNLARKANFLCTTNLILKKEIVMRHKFSSNKKYGIVVDYLYFQMLRSGLSIYYLKEILITHRKLHLIQVLYKLYITSKIASVINTDLSYSWRELKHEIKEIGHGSLKNYYSYLSIYERLYLYIIGYFYLIIFWLLNPDLNVREVVKKTI